MGSYKPNEKATEALAAQEDRPVTSKPSRKLPNPKLRIDNEGVARQTIIVDSSETNDEDRDLARGEGGTIDLPARPGDLSKDD